ncbi:MAG: hypothetical protein V1844_18640 [Pseudomonadota bacterium]
MDFQLYASEEGFFLLASKISRDLETLETCATGNAKGGNQRDHEILKKEIRRIAPGLKGLRLNCLCLSLSTPYQNQSISFFKTLERLNALIEQFEGYNEESASPVQPKTAQDSTALMNSIVETRWQLAQIADNPARKQ